MTTEETVTITRSLYEGLLEDRAELDRLHSNGVDSWEGYAIYNDEEDHD